jgi:hypothetical protein
MPPAHSCSDTAEWLIVGTAELVLGLAGFAVSVAAAARRGPLGTGEVAALVVAVGLFAALAGVGAWHLARVCWKRRPAADAEVRGGL